MFVHKSSAKIIAETELENRFSNLHRLVTRQTFTLLHLICLFLVFRLRFHNGVFLSIQEGSCVLSASALPPLYSRLAVRGFISVFSWFDGSFLAVSTPLCGFVAATLLCCKRLCQRRMLICFLQTEEQRVQTQLPHGIFDHNSIWLQEVHGRDEFLHAIQVLAPRFRLFGTFFLIMKRRIASTEIFFLKTHKWHLWLLIKVVII